VTVSSSIQAKSSEHLDSSKARDTGNFGQTAHQIAEASSVMSGKAAELTQTGVQYLTSATHIVGQKLGEYLKPVTETNAFQATSESYSNSSIKKTVDNMSEGVYAATDGITSGSVLKKIGRNIIYNHSSIGQSKFTTLQPMPHIK